MDEVTAIKYTTKESTIKNGTNIAHIELNYQEKGVTHASMIGRG